MRIVAGVVMAMVCSVAFATEPMQRTLTFEDRVNAQAAIARVYYTHQGGVTKPFEDAVPRSVHENRVRAYLAQSVALSLYWKTVVTDEALGRELERMTNASRMPERLNELFAALGNDPFLIKECLARPILVERLTHNFQAMDPALHVKERRLAERLRSQIATGLLDPSAEHPNRTVNEIAIGDAETGDPSNQRRSHQTLSRDQFLQVRAGLPENTGQASEIAETRGEFGFAVILSETADALRVANYSVRKVSWDDWWTTVRGGLDGATVEAVASGHALNSLSRPSRVAARGAACSELGWHNGSLDDAPYYGVSDGRWGNTAVWTGSEMLIFGGYPNSFSVDDHGRRYDPATDTWMLMTAKNAPTPRTNHTAVWTGTSMIVWGGNVQSTAGIRQTGGRYDPSTDTWTRVSTRNAPLARYSHTAVWTGTEMVIWGGIGATSTSGVLVNTGGRYNPDTDTWRPTSTIGAPSPRSEHTAVWTGSRMVVWSAGSGGRYDPVADTWLPVGASGLDARFGHTAVWTGHFMVIWGGTHTVIDQNNGHPQFFNVPTDAGARYNPSTDRWSPTSLDGAPPPRSGHAAVWTGTEMLIWGGAGAGRRYDVTTDTWTPMSDVGAVAWGEGQTAVWTGHQMIAWGGLRPLGPPVQLLMNTGGRYDPTTDTWTPTSLGSGANGQTSVWTGSQMIVWGGLSGGAQRFDPATDSWSEMTSAGEPTARVDHTAVWTGSSMVVWGGRDGLSNYLDSGGRYDPSTDSWSPVSTSGPPSARALHRALWTGSEMLIWGGLNASGLLGTGGRYDPTSDHWTGISTANAPSPREYHTAVWASAQMVIWGGLGESDVLQSGARYDPQTDSWTPTSLSNVPSARFNHTAVWVGDRMVVWGGSTSFSGPTATGAVYDPVQDTWTTTSTAGFLIGHAGHSAVSTGRAMIVWGGRIGSSPPSPARNTGLLYDPVADHWTKLSKIGEPEFYYSHTAIWTGSSMIVWSGSRGGQFIPADPIDVDCDGDGVSVLAGDCDDTDPSTYPAAPSVCDGKVNNCSDPVWPDITGSFQDRETDFDQDGFTVCQGDRDDNNSTIYPGAPELCDGIENDCSLPGWPTVPADEADVSDVVPFADALIRVNKSMGLYQADVANIELGNRPLFSGRVHFPANVPTGSYDVTVMLFNGGEMVTRNSAVLQVSKGGADAWIYERAHDQAAAYGLCAIAGALLLGWAAHLVFRKI
jgi:N-acetylneuraminic acid mutarotase